MKTKNYDKLRKKSRCYDKGWMDCVYLLESGLTIYFVSQTIWSTGFCRKTKGKSNPRLYNYCEGMNDCLNARAKIQRVPIKDDRVPYEGIGL